MDRVAIPEASRLEAAVFEGSHEALAVHGRDGDGAGVRVLKVDEAEAPRRAGRSVPHQLRQCGSLRSATSGFSPSLIGHLIGKRRSQREGHRRRRKCICHNRGALERLRSSKAPVKDARIMS